jgi:hypothetical protein
VERGAVSVEAAGRDVVGELDRPPHAGRAASTGRPPAPPMSVATHPGPVLLTRIPSRRSSAASMRVNAFRAAFDAR